MTAADSHTALRCMIEVAKHHGLDLSIERIIHDHALTDAPIPPERLVKIARDNGLRARWTTLRRRDLSRAEDVFPIAIRLSNGNWVTLLGLRTLPDGKAQVLIRDPLAAAPEPFVVGEDELHERWDGRALLLSKARDIRDPNQPFGVLWFVPELLRQKRLLMDVALAAVFLYALGLATPIFFQIIIDKVLVHESYTTLTVLAVGIVVALLFDAVFTYLRRYLLLYATNRIDIRVATRTFRHLLRLPVSYFEAAPAGALVKHMQQGARIREFLTGRLFLTLLDALSLFVFIPVLLLYSVDLTLIVIGFTAIIGLTVALLVGPFRRRLRALYEAEAERQGLLVESIHGMGTVKSLTMEPVQGERWDNCSATAVRTRFQVEKVSTLAQAATGLLEKLMVVAIIGGGTLLVFDGAITIGALVAFNMLAGRVSGPLVQIVTMVHEYQEVALSVRMLGQVMNHRPERDESQRGIIVPVKGRIDFEDVTFRYGDGPPALEDVSFSVPAGSVLGVVGRSGCGKTTITRLLQGLYSVQQGVVRLDGVDLREIDLVHLRRNIGVVLQDSFLFRGTVRENIASPKPNASFEDVVEAARLAGATEFIERLPRGFDTLLEENAANLSGGQRQRLAIARALITRPRILILDEATSALDPDSELIIRRNLRHIARGRTVVVVSHRLSTLTDADAIVVVERGRVADAGRHQDLLSRCTVYRHLWNQQTRQVA